ncbi:efflux RND transporter periplasmic adaptor subunit [Nodosilinea sp. E11]|uniref:efflux RND transporter periplasmic adaptor subunit n=1 Tax=Nodosilinea sp. E11 TaxID=3037479 RepID=UPI002934D4F2|nr:efflux RND transporter periplasmic adaptor subunit [Nodosilinea sp. E11]WOD37028.1 efflux RND transporter periplasmic adaptor subunit [Nodosilinea sp. E11]
MSVSPTRQLIHATLLLSLMAGSSSFLSGCSSSQSESEAATPPPLAVKVQSVENGTLQSVSEFVGTLEAAERVALQPQTNGRVQQVFAASGDRVTQGSPILALSVDQAQADVAGAQAGVTVAQAGVATAEAQLQTAQANRSKAAAEVELQKSESARAQELVAKGAIAQRDAEIAKRNLEGAIADLQAADDQVNAAQTAVAQARANVSQAQAKVSSVGVGLTYKQVTAPIAGEVGDFNVKVGDYVSVGQTLTTLTQNNTLDMRITVPSTESGRLTVGLPVELIDPNTGNQIATGSISFVSPRIDATSQGMLAKARFDNRQGTLRDGQYVKARVIWGQSSKIMVPLTAVTRIGGQGFVYVVETQEKDGKTAQVVTQRPVKLGELQGDRYEILEGIQTGDTIAVSNTLKLRNGAPVQVES